MHIKSINSPNFEGGVTLRKVDLDENTYKKINEIATNDNLDLTVSKARGSIYAPAEDVYFVRAVPDFIENAYEKKLYEIGSILIDKQANQETVFQKIYETVLDTVKILGEKLTKNAGKKYEFLKYLK